MVDNEKRDRLVTALANELMERSVNITPGSCVYFAGYLVDRVIAEGWQWHPKVVTEADIDFNKVAVKQEPLADWEKELLYDPTHDEAVWKTIIQLPSVDYVVNRAGIVMNKTTRETVAPSFNRAYLQWEVIVDIDETKYHLLPERIAEELFEPVERLVVDPPVDLKKVSEWIEETQGEKIEFVEPTWVRIPKFEDYEVNSLGVVRNFWTKRVLSENALANPDERVELHDKHGSPWNMTLKAVMLESFPKED